LVDDSRVEGIGHHAAIWLCIWAALGPAPLVAEDPVAELTAVEVFSIGGLDADGRLNRGEIALRAILDRQDAFEILRKLTTGQSPETTAYAFAGIRQIAPDRLPGLLELAQLKDAPIRCGSKEAPYLDTLEGVIEGIGKGDFVDRLRMPVGPDGRRDPVAFLETYPAFRLGFNNWSKELSAGQKAFWEILDRPSGVADFVRLARSPNNAAVSYGLLGLHSLAPKQFQIEADRIRSSQGSDKGKLSPSKGGRDATVDSGCFGAVQVPIAEMVHEIAEGKFDHHFPIDRVPAAKRPKPELPDPWPTKK